MKKVSWALALLGGLCGSAQANPSASGLWQHQIETRVFIESSTTNIWAVLLNFDRHPDWNPFIRQIEGKAVAGEHLRVRVQPVGASEMAFEPLVMVAKPHQELRWKGKFLIPGLFDGEHYFQLLQDGDRGVTLVHGERFSGLLVPLFRAHLDATTRPGFDAMNQALRREVLRHTDELAPKSQ